MDLLSAHKELLRRQYQWSLRDAAWQARENYPLLRNIVNPETQVFFAIVESLSLEQRLLLAQALVKSVYFPAPKEVDIAALLGDQFLPEEQQLAEKYHAMSRQMSLSGMSRMPRRDDCIPTRAKNLAKTVTGHLSEVMQSPFVREEPFCWTSEITLFDWTVTTELHFSGPGIECEYWLMRSDDPQIVSADITEQFLGQSRHFDFGPRLGITAIWWIVECEQDVASCLESAGSLCLHVMSQLLVNLLPEYVGNVRIQLHQHILGAR